MPPYNERVQKLLKRSAKFRAKVEKALVKHDENVDLVKWNEIMGLVDQEIVRLGRKRARKSR